MPGRKPLAADTPLQHYLNRRKLTRAAFAERCSEVLGQVVRPNMVHKWASGHQRPGRLWRDLLAKATAGEIPVAAPWPRSTRKDGKRARRRAA
jgi:hypothetical protein